MAEITLVRQEPVQVTEADKAVARRVIFGIVDGLGERGKKQWRRLWNNILRLAKHSTAPRHPDPQTLDLFAEVEHG